MKRYTPCPICGARALVEYGAVLREHSRPTIGAGGVRSICHGPQPVPAPARCEPVLGSNVLSLSQGDFGPQQGNPIP